MASQKRSVNLTDETVRFIERYSRDIGEEDMKWSAAINYAISQLVGNHDSNIMNAQKAKELDAMMRMSLPDLTEADWQEILNVHNGVYIDLTPPHRLASDMLDCYGAISIEELTPAQADLAKRLHAMPQVQQAAILWTCRQFWSQPRDFGTLMEMVQAAIRGE